jgi:hypothetical protein
MRTFYGIIACALCLHLGAAPCAAQEKVTSIWPKLKVDKTGEFKDAKTEKYLRVRIKELVSVDIILVEIDSNEPAFLVRGLSIKEYADDSIIELRGEWKVTGTGPYGIGVRKKTYFIVEPVAKDKASFALAGDENAVGIWPRMKVGKMGEFKDPKTKKNLDVRIKELLSGDLMMVRIGSDEPAFLVRGLPTKGLADDTEIELKGEWKVTGTGPYGTPTKHYYIVEPVKK